MAKGTLKQKQQQQDKEKQAYAFYVAQGWTPEQSVGIVGNLIRESNLNTTIVGTADDKQSQGLAQWHGDRLKALKNKYGNNWTDFKNQLEFVDWELKNTEKSAGDKLKASKGVWEAGRVVSDHYERPKVKFVGDEKRQTHVTDLASKFKGVKLTPEDIPYFDASYANSVAPYLKEAVTSNIHNFDYLPQTTTFASVPDSAQKEDKTEETDKDIKEVEQKTKEYNFLEELQKEDYVHLQPEQSQQQAVPQVDFNQQYEQISQFVDNPVSQQGGSWQEKLINRPKKPTIAEIIAEGDTRKTQQRAQADNTSTAKPNTSHSQKELENISAYASKHNISIKDASERLYNANQQSQNNQIRAYVPQTTKSKVWEVATHPTTAAGYAVRNEQLPENFSRGAINSHEMAVDIVNPFFYTDQAGKFVKNTSEGNFAEAGMNALNVLPIAAEYQTIGRGLSKAGRMLGTEEGLLSNAYKINPFAKGSTLNKFDKDSFLRQIDEATFNEGLESGLIRGKQDIDMTSGEDIININKAFGDDAYYRKGSPYYDNQSRYPYMYEVKKGEEAFIPKVNGRTRKYTTENTSVRVSREPIPVDEATVYKHNWLQGYKEVPKTTPKDELRQGLRTQGFSFSPEFKSEINWGNWNKEIPENPQLMQEYDAIEQTAKANDTWMKNPNGSNFVGTNPTKEELLKHGIDMTPEQAMQAQFIQQNSKNIPKNVIRNVDGSVQDNYHGSSATDITEFKEELFKKGAGKGIFGKGNYTTKDKNSGLAYQQLAADHGKSDSKLYSLYINSKNPISTNANDILREYGTNTRNIFKNIEELPTRQQLAEQYKLAGNSDEKIDKVLAMYNETPREAIKIPFKENDYIEIKGMHTGQEQITPFSNNLKSAIGNNGMFDMNNPNIYKSIVPIAGASYLATQGQEESKKFQQGGQFSENELAFLSEIAIKDNNGYWDKNNQGKVVSIEGSEISMKNVKQPLIGIGVDKNGKKTEQKTMKTNKNYSFEQAVKVIEIPLFKK